jgi:glycosyltransferase involved in cell wall biosynthesis
MVKSIISRDKNINRRNKPQKPIRVVLVHPSVGIIWSGGSEIFTLELARHLEQYFEIEILSGTNCEPFCRPAGGISRDRAYKIVKHSLLAPLFSRLATHPDMLIEHLSNFFPCASYLIRKPADLIFPCNDYGGLAMAALVRKIRGTPILFTEHAGAMNGAKALTRNLNFKPDMLVLHSEAIAEIARKLQPEQPTAVIPNGVNLDRFTKTGATIEFKLSRPRVLCVASLDRNNHKRIELIINAMAKIPDASLLICGDGIDRDYYQAMGDKLLGAERLQIRSFTHEQMPAVYRSADVFTLPSFDEPFGLAYIEAMASGLPVVAPDDQMRRHIVGDGGILCDVTDSDIYSQGLVKALNQDWGDQPRQNALRFSWDAIAIQYRDLILKTINQSSKK